LFEAEIEYHFKGSETLRLSLKIILVAMENLVG